MLICRINCDKMAAALGKAVRSIIQARMSHVTPALGSYSTITNNHRPSALREGWAKPAFDMAKMTHLLDHDNQGMRQEMREFLRDPVFTPQYVMLYFITTTTLLYKL